MKTLFIYLAILCCTCAQTIAQNYRWAKSFGSNQSDYGHSIQSDLNGNVYVCGQFKGTVDFDPGPGVLNITATGQFENLFVLKLNANGNLVNAISYKTDAPLSSGRLILGHTGNIFITSEFVGTVDLDPGPGFAFVSTSVPQGFFILELDTTLQYKRGRSVSGATPVYSSDQSTDGKHLWITGHLSIGGSVDFDPGPNQALDSTNSGLSGFVLKLDTALNFQWVRLLHSTNSGNLEAMSLDCDSAGNIYSTGYFSVSADFDPSNSNYALTANGSYDIYFSKLDANGNFVWAKTIGGSGHDVAWHLETDKVANVYVSGLFPTSVDFDPGAGTDLKTSAGNFDLFIMKLNAAGNYLWSDVMGGAGNDDVHSFSQDHKGNLLVCGWFQNTVDFDPAAPTQTLSSPGANSTYILKLSTSGAFKSVRSLDPIVSGGSVYGVSIFADTSGTVLMTGSYNYQVDLNPDFAIQNFSTSSSTDAFVLKLGPCNLNLSGSNSHTICSGQVITLSVSLASQYTWQPGGGILSQVTVQPASSTIYTITGANASDCKDTVTIAIMTSLCTDLDNRYADRSIEIFPNPNNGSFIVTQHAGRNLRLTNMTGQVLDVIAANQASTDEIKVLGLSEGVYFLRCDGWTKKIVVLK